MPNVSKTMCIEMGHRLQYHQGKCRNLHGHSYKIEVFAEGDIITDGPSTGMVIDFAILKKAMLEIDDHFDHIMCLQYNDPLLDNLVYCWTEQAKEQLLAWLIDHFKVAPYYPMLGTQSQKFILIEHPPTAEILARIWLGMIVNYFGTSAMKFKIKVWETNTSCCEVEWVTNQV